MCAGKYDYDTDYIRLYWQVEALKGQVRELERERNRTGNVLWFIRQMLIRALRGLGAEGPFRNKTDQEIITLFSQLIQIDYRFSPCPNAAELRCRPIAMQYTRDGDAVYCEDCGWDVRDEIFSSDDANSDDSEETTEQDQD